VLVVVLMLGRLLWSMLSICYNLMKGCCQGLLGAGGTEDGLTTGPPSLMEQHPLGMGCDQVWKGPGV